MPKQFTDEEYALLLPKKQVGTAIIFLNEKEEILLVKPDYRKEWLLPGGSTDEDESQLQCAVRETKEEINLDIYEPKLVGIYYGKKKGFFTDSLKFIFFGGVLSNDQISIIKLQQEELIEYKFATLNTAIPLLSLSLQKSIPACIEAIKNSTTVYLE